MYLSDNDQFAMGRLNSAVVLRLWTHLCPSVTSFKNADAGPAINKRHIVRRCQMLIKSSSHYERQENDVRREEKEKREREVSDGGF